MDSDYSRNHVEHSRDYVEPPLLQDYGDFARYYIDNDVVRDDRPPAPDESKSTSKRGTKRRADSVGEEPAPPPRRLRLSTNNPPPRRSARNQRTIAEHFDTIVEHVDRDAEGVDTVAEASETIAEAADTVAEAADLVAKEVDRDVKEAAEILLCMKYARTMAVSAATSVPPAPTQDEDGAISTLKMLHRPVEFDVAAAAADVPLVPEDEAPTSGPSAAPGTGRRKKPWLGTPSGFGTSREKPPASITAPGHLLSTPWNCAEADCATGFTWVTRDGAQGLGRKTISQYFGRNKRQTADIHGDVWHIYCRKHYQRAKYATDAMDVPNRCRELVSSLRIQLDRIRLWRPNATFTVQLTKSMIDRMDHWDVCLRNAHNVVANAQTAFNIKYPINNAKGKAIVSAEATFPRALADVFRRYYSGNSFNFGRMYSVLSWILDRINAGDLTSMPPMEFLISEMSANETGVTDPTNNYQLWLATLS